MDWCYTPVLNLFRDFHLPIMSILYEIVELADGEVVLRKANEEDSEPLLSISFSQEALYFLNSSKFAVARAMIEAGLEAASSEDLDSDMDDDAVVH